MPFTIADRLYHCPVCSQPLTPEILVDDPDRATEGEVLWRCWCCGDKWLIFHVTPPGRKVDD